MFKLEHLGVQQASQAVVSGSAARHQEHFIVNEFKSRWGRFGGLEKRLEAQSSFERFGRAGDVRSIASCTSSVRGISSSIVVP